MFTKKSRDSHERIVLIERNTVDLIIQRLRYVSNHVRLHFHLSICNIVDAVFFLSRKQKFRQMSKILFFENWMNKLIKRIETF